MSTSATGLPEWALSMPEKRLRFCEEYLIDFNEAAAYDRAGYSALSYSAARTSACRLMKDPLVLRYIEYLKRQRAVRSQIKQDRVLEELARIAFSDITNFMSWSQESGVVLKSSSELEEGASLVIAEISEQQMPRGGKSRSLKLHSKMEALKILAKHLGILDNDLNVAIATVRKYGYEIVDNYPTQKKNPLDASISEDTDDESTSD